MSSHVSSFMNHFHKGTEHLLEMDPAYKKEREEIKDVLRNIGLKSTAAMVASIALGVLGFACAATGGSIAILGVTLIFVGLPVGYLAYNAYRIAENVDDALDEPTEYITSHDMKPYLDKEKVRSKLRENTFGFRWVIDAAIEHYTKNKFDGVTLFI